MTFLGQLGNAYGTARHCNMLISFEAVRTRAKEVFGDKAVVPIDQATDILFIVDGFSAMSDDMIFAGPMTKKEKARKCVDMLKLYGPEGTVIRGAVKP